MRRCQIWPFRSKTPLSITTVALPGGNRGFAYFTGLAATGGTLPYTWTLISGTLPPGISLNASTGSLTGTPTNAETDNPVFQVTDAIGAISTKTLTIVISASLTITTSSPLPSGNQGVAYTPLTFGQTGGIAPITWSIISGTLDSGMSLSSAGVLSGTPANAEVDSITVQATDSLGAIGTKVFSLTVIAAPTLSITTASPLPSGVKGTAYSFSMTAIGGVPPYSWSIVSGTLDTGVSFSSAGAFSGTPANAEIDTLVIKVTDSIGATAQNTFSLTFAAAALGRALGTNLNSISNFNSEQPFLNLLSMAGSNNTYLTAWSPNGTMTYAQLMAPGVLDANGYPTTLPGNQPLQTRMNQSLNNQDGSGFGNGLPPGAATYYPTGSYTMQCQGAFTGSVGGDAVSGSLASSSPNISVSGTTITSTMTAGQSAVITFNLNASSVGLYWTLTALPSNTNYWRNASIVQTSQVALYNSGKICHPNFLAAISNAGQGGYNRLRFMDMLQGAAGQIYEYQLPALTTGSSTTQTLPSAWAGVGGTYPCVLGRGSAPFDTPQTNTVTVALNSTTAVFGHAFTQSVGTGDINLYIPVSTSWADRNPFTGLFWGAANGAGGGGISTPPMVPYEAVLQIANETNCDAWITVPITINQFTDPTYVYWTGLANLIKANLKPGLKCYLEYGNEIFLKSEFFRYCQMLSPTDLGVTAQFAQYMGAQTARMADAFLAVFGSAGMASTIRIGPSTQFDSGNGVAFLTEMMNAPNFVSFTGHAAPYLNFTHWSFAPYFPETNMSDADLTTLLNTAVPLDDLFACMYGNVGTAANGNHTYASVVGGGFITSAISVITSDVAQISTQPWKALPIHSYEMGESFPNSFRSNTAGTYTGPYGGGLYNSLQKAASALCGAAHRDQRMGLCYYDPTGLLFSFYATPGASGKTGLLPMATAAGITSMNKFNNCNAMSQFGDWGALENIMQLPSSGGSGTAASYPVYSAIMKYASGN